MSASAFAALPEPPHCAVVFGSLHRGDDGVACAETAARMAGLAARQPGCLGAESVVCDAPGLGIAMAYWRDQAATAGCKRHAGHAVARAHGRAAWYADSRVRVARVARACGS